jgi:Cu/Ag efflux protein CusF
MVDGRVVKIDEPAGKITLKHGPLKQFDMDEGMTMVFRAQDPAMLRTVKVGDKIKFMPERINGQFTVTKIQRAK